MTGARAMFLLAAAAIAAAASKAAVSNSNSPNSAWAHDWDTPSSAWWGYGAMGGELFSDDTVAFVARTYRVVALSLCVGPSMNMTVAN